MKKYLKMLGSENPIEAYLIKGMSMPRGLPHQDKVQ